MARQSNTPKLVTKKHIARLERERQQVNLIRWISIGGIAVVVLLLVYGYLKINYLQLLEPVAEVNGVKITVGDWKERVILQRVNYLDLYNRYVFYQQNFGMDTSQQQQQLLSTLQTPEILGQQVIDQMTEEIIVKQEAKKQGITVSAEEIEKSIRDAYGYFPDGTPTPTITPTEFKPPTLSPEQLTIYPSTAIPTITPTSTVGPTNTPDLSVTATATSTVAPPTPTFVPEVATATATPYTLDGYKSQYTNTIDELKKYGVSEATLRSVYEYQLIRNKLMDVIAKDTPHTEEQVWARHILVDDNSTAATARILLLHGEDFAKVAKDFSKDTGSAASGGDLGWFGKGQMVAEFEQAAFSQKIGEIGEPVQTQYGYHIIQVIDRKEMPVSDSQYDQLKQTTFTDWTSKAKESATIKTYDVWKTIVPTEPVSLNQQAQ